MEFPRFLSIVGEFVTKNTSQRYCNIFAQTLRGESEGIGCTTKVSNGIVRSNDLLANDRSLIKIEIMD